MTPKEKAEELINSYRIILMNEDTECGNEILCTSISKHCALIAVDEIINLLPNINLIPPIQRKPDEFYFQYWHSVKREIELL
jgi:hypothetical protein